MIDIEVKIGSKELAKVLHFYGLLDSTSEFKIVCPFHNDINPSMQVNIPEGFFYCHGCGATGNAFDFVRLANPKLDDLQKWKLYFEILRSKEVKHLKLSKRTKVKKESVQALIEAMDYYYNLKTVNWNKKDSPESEYMTQRGFSKSSLNKCKAKLTYNDAYPIIFPMLDMGEFRGWVCRTTNEKIAKKRKYLYNEGFSRSNTLVGTYNAEEVYLVEGYMDWLKMKQNGAKKVAAILGWKITDQQVYKLKSKGVKRIISALDNDSCGRKGSKYLKNFFEVIRFKFPEGVKDPGDMDRKTFEKANRKTLKK